MRFSVLKVLKLCNLKEKEWEKEEGQVFNYIYNNQEDVYLIEILLQRGVGMD